jgi:hypothetical protein
MTSPFEMRLLFLLGDAASTTFFFLVTLLQRHVKVANAEI